MLQEYIKFLAELNQNNNRTWFDQNRDRYKILQEEFKHFISDLIPKIAEFDPQLKFLTPTDCIYRINRDIRFTHDKTPYKTNVGAIFGLPGQKKGVRPGYYMEIRYDGTSYIGGGWYIIEPSEMYNLRLKIAENPKELRKILDQSDFKNLFKELQGEVLKTVPKGFAKDSPDLDLLKRKNFITGRRVEITNIDTEMFENEVLNAFKVLSPLVMYLRKIS